MNTRLTIRFTTDETRRLRRAARNRKITTSDLVRSAVRDLLTWDLRTGADRPVAGDTARTASA